jgi:hypothetical protein
MKLRPNRTRGKRDRSGVNFSGTDFSNGWKF